MFSVSTFPHLEQHQQPHGVPQHGPLPQHGQEVGQRVIGGAPVVGRAGGRVVGVHKRLEGDLRRKGSKQARVGGRVEGRSWGAGGVLVRGAGGCRGERFGKARREGAIWG